jgi:WD40 repeat protein
MLENTILRTPSRWLTAFRQYFYGPDVFISYARKDSIAYAFALADRLDKKQCTPFLDQRETYANAKTPQSVITKLKQAGLLVVVGSAGAVNSAGIMDELKEFPAERTVLVIDVDGALREPAVWQQFIVGLPPVAETKAAFIANSPSDTVVERIISSIQYTKQRKRISNAIAVAFSLLAIVALVIGVGLTTISKQQDSISKQNARIKENAETIGDNKKTIDKQSKEAQQLTESLTGAQHSLTTAETKLSQSAVALGALNRRVAQAQEDIRLKTEQVVAKETELGVKRRELDGKVKEVAQVTERLDSTRYEEAGLRSTAMAADINRQEDAIKTSFEFIDLVHRPAARISPRAWNGISATLTSMATQQKRLFQEVGDEGVVFSGAVHGLLSADSTRLIVYDDTGNMAIKNLTTNESTKFRAAGISEVAATPHYVVAKSASRAVYVRGLIAGTASALSHSATVTGISAFHHADLCVAVQEGGVSIWNLESRTRTILDSENEVWVKASMSGSDRYLAVLSMNNPVKAQRTANGNWGWGERLKVWDLVSHKMLFSKVIFTKESRTVDGLEFSPDEAYLAIGGGGQVDVIGLPDGKEVFHHDFSTPHYAMTNLGFVHWFPDRTDLVFNNAGAAPEYHFVSLTAVPNHLQPFGARVKDNLYRMTDIDSYRQGWFAADGSFTGLDGKGGIVQLRKTTTIASYEEDHRYDVANNTIHTLFPLPQNQCLSVQNQGDIYEHRPPPLSKFDISRYNLPNMESMSSEPGYMLWHTPSSAGASYEFDIEKPGTKERVKHLKVSLQQGPGYLPPRYAFSKNQQYLLLAFPGIMKDTTMLWSTNASDDKPIYSFPPSVYKAEFLEGNSLLLYNKTPDFLPELPGGAPKPSLLQKFDIITKTYTTIDISAALRGMTFDPSYPDVVEKVVLAGSRALVLKRCKNTFYLELHDLASHAKLITVYQQRKRPVVSISEDKSLFAVGAGKSLTTYRLQTGVEVASFPGQMDDITRIVFCMHDQYLVTGGQQGYVTLWHGGSGASIGTKVEESKAHVSAIQNLYLNGSEVRSYSIGNGVSHTFSFESKFKSLCQQIANRANMQAENCKCKQAFPAEFFRCIP